jgi:hypothetical protein
MQTLNEHIKRPTLKRRILLSQFQNDVIWITIFLILAIWATVFTSNVDPGNNYFNWVGGVTLSVIGWGVFFGKCVSLNIQLHKMYIFKVKITEVRSNMKDTKYYFKLLRPFFFFPIWYSDWHFSLNLAERDIEIKKRKAREERELYFRREVITIKKY